MKRRGTRTGARGRRDPRRGGAPPAARRAPAPTRTPIMFQFRAARRRQRRGGTTDSNDSPPYLSTPCRRPTGDVALNFPGERAAEPGMAAPFIQVSPTFNNTFLRCAAAARWNGSKKKLNSDRRHSLCNSDTTPVGNSFSVEATLEELAPAQRTEIAKRHWHEYF